MKKYGSKDLMRMESLKDKSHGDYMNQLLYAYNMACAITEPGKAMARGYAAKEIFGEHCAVSQVFFERAYDLGGPDVKPSASVNPFDQSDEGIESHFEDIPEREQPASRRKKKKILEGTVNRKTSYSRLMPLGKLNTIKAIGPKFSLYEYPSGILEVWKNKDNRYRLIYTVNHEPIYFIDEERTFKYDNKVDTWQMVDYIESEYVSNLAPLYGKSIAIYVYD